MQKSTALAWDDLRFALSLSRAGSLAGAARTLGVDHTTVGRRIEAAEQALGVRLFTRSRLGYALTQDGERLFAPLRAVEEAVLSLRRAVDAETGGLTGLVRVTSPETFGVAWLAPRLAAFGAQHPGLTVELTPSGKVLDLGRGEAEIAVRFFRSRSQNLVAQRAAEVRYGLYGSHTYLARPPEIGPDTLAAHPLLLPPATPPSVEGRWLARWARGAGVSFVSELSVALLAAAKAGAGLAPLPCYLADAEPSLMRVPMPDPPAETLWLTVHQDVRTTPRVRALLQFLLAELKADRAQLRGERVG